MKMNHFPLNGNISTKRIFLILTISILLFSCETTKEIIESEIIPEVSEPIPTVEKEADKEEFTVNDFAIDLQQTLKSKSLEEALLLFENIPEELKDDPELNYLEASLLISSGDTEKSTNIINKLLLEDPTNTDIQFLQALIYKQDGKANDSKIVLDTILKEDPTNVDANVEVANLYMSKNNFSVADKYFLQALEGDEKSPAGLFGHALASWYMKNDDEAEKTLVKLLDVYPENSMAWAYLSKFKADKGNYTEAVEHMEKAVEYDPNYYFNWLDLGSYYQKINNIEKTEYAWTRAIEIDPEYFLAYAYRGGMRDEHNDYSGALSDYENVITYNPDYYFAYEAMGQLYWKEKNWQEARNSFLKAYQKNPKNSSYALMISATYHKEEKSFENKEFLKSALKNVDRNSLDYQVLRLYYDGIGDSAVLTKVVNEENSTTRGRMLFYMALFYEIKDLDHLATQYYLEVVDMQAPMFFEYRLCEWAIEEKKSTN